MFFSNNKDNIVQKNDALLGRDLSINNDLLNNINGRNLNQIPDGFKSIVVGMGCFWGAEKLFWHLEGVYVTSVGYAGGYTKNPTYEEVCSGLTGHTEVVNIIYDPTLISLRQIMIIFWEGHNPTQGMRQGNDHGTQYRSAVFTNNNEDIKVVKETMSEFQGQLNKNNFGKITTDIKNDVKYYFAENYHQQYLYKNPNGYCGLGGCGTKFK
ncbi:peptide-methionine (S)-S-oxide reductase MsrA [Alphaproteobacteria bacterium]|nr:peptide-methionine (S)-S-oxide reductase MsrA [Alphaproteobacteria bacterium]